jgi:ATP-dependent helicase/nuclease subunit A
VVRLAQATVCVGKSDTARLESARADAMPARDQQALVWLWQRLERLRRRYGRAGVAGLLEEALATFDYDLAILRRGDGRRRFANVMKLLRLAEQYESVEGPDLAGLLAFLRRKGVVGDREGNAAVLAEGEDVVRVMTIHQAKGLEFPVVVVAGLGVGRRRRGSPTFLVDGQGRKAVRVRQSKAEGERGHFSLGPATAMVEEKEDREREEEDRLYYVATTRAEERLVLVGTRVPPGRGGAADTDLLSRVLAVLGAEVPAVGDEVRPLEGLDLVVKGLSPLVPLPQPLGSGRQRGSCPPAPIPVLLPAPATASGRVSFSSLHAYAECPRRYYVERVLRLHLQTDGDESGADAIDRIEGSGRGAEGRAVGQVVHRVLQSLPLEQVPTADCVDTLVQVACADLEVEATASTVGVCRDLALGFWRSPLAALPGLAMAQREQTFAFAHGGVVVTGVMDALIRGADEWQVIDYKTNRLGESAPADLAAPYVLQQQIYALACLLAGAPQVTMSLVFLERPQQPVSLTCAQGDVSDLRGALAIALDGMAGGEFDERRGPWCGSCESEGLCRVVARSSAMV